jgi:hypothetical protein
MTDWLAGVAGGVGNVEACLHSPGVSRLWGLSPHAHDATRAHAVLLCKEFFPGLGPVVYLRQ